MVFGGFRGFSGVFGGFRGPPEAPRGSPEAPQRLPEVPGDFRFFDDLSTRSRSRWLAIVSKAKFVDP